MCASVAEVSFRRVSNGCVRRLDANRPFNPVPCGEFEPVAPTKRNRVLEPRRGGSPPMVYLEPLGRSVRRDVAEILLGDRSMRARLICDDERCCPHGINSMLDDARPHAVRSRARSLAELAEMPHRSWRLHQVAKEARPRPASPSEAPSSCAPRAWTRSFMPPPRTPWPVPPNTCAATTANSSPLSAAASDRQPPQVRTAAKRPKLAAAGAVETVAVDQRTSISATSRPAR